MIFEREDEGGKPYQLLDYAMASEIYKIFCMPVKMELSNAPK
jgi:hypothetical protein